MARIRTIKPEFFLDDELAELEPLSRILFIGLWCLADKAGRLEDKPNRIKIQILPYDNANVDNFLDDLHDAGFIVRYQVDGKKYIQIRTFAEHQRPHHTEKESVYPPPNREITVKEPLNNGYAPVGKERKGKERNIEKPNPNPKTPVDNSTMEQLPEKPALSEKPKDPEPEDVKFSDFDPVPSKVPLLDGLKAVMGECAKIYPKPHDQRQIVLFVESNIRDRHPDAIMHCLKSLIAGSARDKPIHKIRAYLEAALKIEDGKHNARDEESKCNGYKNLHLPRGMSTLKDGLLQAIKGGVQ